MGLPCADVVRCFQSCRRASQGDYIYHGTNQFTGIHKKDQLQLTDNEKKHYPSHVDHVAHIFPEYYILKVSGFDLTVKDTLDEWIYTLKESEVKPEFNAQGIREAGQKLALLNLSEEERSAYDRHINDVRISRSTLETSFSDGMDKGKAEGLAEGEAKGKAEGKAEGEAEGLAEVAIKLHQLGLSTDQIVSATGFTGEQLKEIFS